MREGDIECIQCHHHLIDDQVGVDVKRSYPELYSSLVESELPVEAPARMLPLQCLVDVINSRD
jgi:hypothetical protein